MAVADRLAFISTQRSDLSNERMTIQHLTSLVTLSSATLLDWGSLVASDQEIIVFG